MSSGNICRSVLIEDVNLQDTFASDIARVEILDGNVRFILCVDRFRMEGNPAEKHVVGRIVMPRTVIPGAIQRVLFALGEASIPLISPSRWLS